MEEDYVSFETAKLLKEKGFDEKCDHLYSGEEISQDISYRTNSNLDFWHDLKDRYSASTQALVLKWIREKYKFSIEVGWWNKWVVNIFQIGNIEFHAELPDSYDSPEEATEAAIKYVLENLIK